MPVGHSPPSENTRLKSKQNGGALHLSVERRECNNSSFSLPAPSNTNDLSWSQQCPTPTPTSDITRFQIPTSLSISTVTTTTVYFALINNNNSIITNQNINKAKALAYSTNEANCSGFKA